jgi:prepilin-type N-terminal cleavage/methylation domain-containing protein
MRKPGRPQTRVLPRGAKSRTKAPQVAGFTLIEIMVVMVLLGLVSALTLPSMQRWHDAVQVQAQSAQVVESLRSTMFSAASRRQDMVVDLSSFSTGVGQEAATPTGTAAVGHARVSMPEGWQVQRVVTATFLNNGLCKPGMAVLRSPRQQSVVIRIAGPACSIDTVSDFAGQSEQ